MQFNVQGAVGFGSMHGRGAGWLQNRVVSGFHHLVVSFTVKGV
jgi:hypothetical protein